MALEELSSECVNVRMDDGQKVITIAHPEHSSGELKIKRLDISFLHVIHTKHTIIALSIVTDRTLYGKQI